jgi:hypothetical protein
METTALEAAALRVLDLDPALTTVSITVVRVVVLSLLSTVVQIFGCMPLAMSTTAKGSRIARVVPGLFPHHRESLLD